MIACEIFKSFSGNGGYAEEAQGDSSAYSHKLLLYSVAIDILNGRYGKAA